MKGLFVLLLVLFFVLQYKLWFSDDGVVDLHALKKDFGAQQLENQVLEKHNQALSAEVQDLKQGQTAIEEHARADLGMIKKDEEFYQVLP